MLSLKLVFVMLAALVSLWLHLCLSAFLIDDAFIHFRMSEHLLRFGEPYYNREEAVLATSSPLWTLLLTALQAIPGALVFKLSILNSLFSLGSSYIWSSLVEKKSPLSRLMVFLTTFSVLTVSSVGLMETPLAIFLLGLSFWFFIRKSFLSFFSLGLACFVRFELGLFCLLLFSLILFKRDRKLHLSTVGILLGAVGPLAFLAYYFPFEMPQTINAKSVVYTVSPAENIQVLLRAVLGDGVFREYRYLIVAWLVLSLVACIFAIFSGVGAQDNSASRSSADSMRLSLVSLLGSVALFLLYLMKGVLIFSWYVPLVLVPMFYALVQLSFPTSKSRNLFFATLLSLPFLVVLARNLEASFGKYDLFTDYENGKRVQMYLQIGRHLRDHFPYRSVLASEIGALGYAYGGKIIDGVGLVSPKALEFHPMAVPEQRSSGLLGAIPAAFVEKEDPDLIASYDVFLEEFLRSEVKSDYVRLPLPEMSVEGIPEKWQSSHFHLYVKKGLMPSDEENSESLDSGFGGDNR